MEKDRKVKGTTELRPGRKGKQRVHSFTGSWTNSRETCFDLRENHLKKKNGREDIRK